MCKAGICTQFRASTVCSNSNINLKKYLLLDSGYTIHQRVSSVNFRIQYESHLVDLALENTTLY